jgi:hypothetical protein
VPPEIRWRVHHRATPQDMPAEPNPSEDPVSSVVVHQFTVLRGMAVAVVIETRDWCLALVQTALARVRLEGNN